MINYQPDNFSVSHSCESISVSYVESISKHGCVDIVILNGVATITRVFVSNGGRNLGIGRELLRRALVEVDGLHLPSELSINPYGDLDFDQLKTFYESFNFVEVSENLFQRKAR